MPHSIISHPAIRDNDERQREESHILLRLCCWFIALIFGALQAWVTRLTMHPDGVSYLDIGDAYWRGDWHNAINAYWSPLYPWILGFVINVFKPSPYWEYALVHLVNFIGFVVTLICFEFFLRTLTVQQAALAAGSGNSHVVLPEWTWYLTGYSAFLTSSLLMITLRFATGDMLVSAIVYFVSALNLRIRMNGGTKLTFAILGLALGIGYLAKTVMFLMSVPFFSAALLLQRVGRAKRGLVAIAAFVIVVGPFLTAISLAKGRLTFGDSGRINYEINVGTVKVFTPDEPGQLHPIRRIAPFHEAYEYGSPVKGTYPLWYDPSYWHEGIKPHFEWKRQLRTLLLTTAECLWISFNLFLGLGVSVGILFLYLIAPSFTRCLRYAGHHWPLWVPALAGIGLYALVVIEPRYVGGLFCLLWIVAFSGVHLRPEPSSRRLLTTAVVAVAIVTCVVVGWQVSRAARGIDIGERHIVTPAAWDAATALRAIGTNPGDKIAVVGTWLVPSQEASYVARLARVRIIAEARPEEYFSASNANDLDTAFAQAGAKAILTFGRPQVEAGWSRLADTDYYVHLLEKTRRAN